MASDCRRPLWELSPARKAAAEANRAVLKARKAEAGKPRPAPRLLRPTLFPALGDSLSGGGGGPGLYAGKIQKQGRLQPLLAWPPVEGPLPTVGKAEERPGLGGPSCRARRRPHAQGELRPLLLPALDPPRQPPPTANIRGLHQEEHFLPEIRPTSGLRELEPFQEVIVRSPKMEQEPSGAEDMDLFMDVEPDSDGDSNLLTPQGGRQTGFQHKPLSR
ncbi:uncharacterized protein LOC103282501 [Anolis carolinensis]|uniref:uncharacterized protein LOC103282501 n=1 Tax=Anolis carolinensis TaxID=28377 RepID=UPI002F2B66EE